MRTENSEDSCTCLTTCAMAAVSEDRTPPLSPPHCHSTNNSTTVCCGATPQHHHTGALPGRRRWGGLEGKKYRYSICNLQLHIVSCVMSYQNILLFYNYMKLLNGTQKCLWLWKKENRLVGFYKGTFFKTLSHFSFFVCTTDKENAGMQAKIK